MKLLYRPSRVMMAGILGFATLGGFAVVAPPAEAGVNIGIYVPVGPPPMREEYRPVAPGPWAVWTPGYWAWTPRGHVWVGGAWRRPPPRYHHWVPVHWHHGHHGWEREGGHWR